MKVQGHIRIAVEGDLPDLTNIYNQAIRAGGATAHLKEQTLESRSIWFANFHPERYPIYIFEKEGAVAGYAYLCPYREGREALNKVAEVSFYVGQQFHRQGIGRALLQYVMDDCQRLGIETLLAFLLEVNNPSIRLLKSFGFGEWGRLPDVAEVNGTRFDHLIYGRRLE